MGLAPNPVKSGPVYSDKMGQFALQNLSWVCKNYITPYSVLKMAKKNVRRNPDSEWLGFDHFSRVIFGSRKYQDQNLTDSKQVLANNQALDVNKSQFYL